MLGNDNVTLKSGSGNHFSGNLPGGVHELKIYHRSIITDDYPPEGESTGIYISVVPPLQSYVVEPVYPDSDGNYTVSGSRYIIFF